MDVYIHSEEMTGEGRGHFGRISRKIDVWRSFMVSYCCVINLNILVDVSKIRYQKYLIL